MTLTVRNLDTGYSYMHSGVSQREVNFVVSALSQDKKPEHRLVVEVK